MSIPLNGVGPPHCTLSGEATSSTVSHLEPVKLEDQKEVHMGSLGLGTALAVAYDLYNDSNMPSQTAHVYSPQLGGFVPLSTVKASAQNSQQMSSHFRPMSTTDQQHYGLCSPLYSSTSAYITTMWTSQHSDAYLTPIAVSSTSVSSTVPTKPLAVISNGSKLRLSAVDGSNVLYVDSTVGPPPVTLIVEEPSVTTPPTNSLNATNVSSSLPTSVPSHVPIPPFSSCSSGSTTSTPIAGTITNYPSSHAASVTNGSVTDVKPSPEQNSYGVDDSLYEISEEEMREIDASLINNPDVMASRQWKYYTETNEWTRATCALMACLFTRDQMANSTVLGRGGSQRARLPSNLVAYVVGTIRKRFNKPAAAVRARMAQKCKDERRFGRLTVTGSGSMYSVDGQEPGNPAPVAAISGKNSVARKARKRPAPGINSSHKTAKSSNGSTPPSDFASTPGYQPTAYNDDACSSTTDSNQLPPVALSPSTDPEQDFYMRSSENCLPTSTGSHSQPPQSSGLSMLLMVPSLDVQASSTSDQFVLSSNHLPPSTELTS